VLQFGQPVDRLWVRETIYYEKQQGDGHMRFNANDAIALRGAGRPGGSG
jgi:hypothetical protein